MVRPNRWRAFRQSPTRRDLPSAGQPGWPLSGVLSRRWRQTAAWRSLGRRGPAADGWLQAAPTAPIPAPDVISTFALTYDLLKAGAPDPWIKVPYRSQLDGAPYAAANCGPTATGMVLESFGIKVAPPALRQ